MDDLLNKNYFTDILICCQENSNFTKYLNNTKNDVGKLFYGYKYFPIPYTKKIKFIHKRNVLISLGGGQYDDLYLKIFKILRIYNEYFDKIIICFSGVYNNKTIRYLNRFSFTKIIENKKNIIQYMNKSNLLIVSGGYHKIEANYLQKPIIAIATQKHQDNLLKKFKLKTNLKYISYKNDKFENILNNYLNKFFIKSKVYI